MLCKPVRHFRIEPIDFNWCNNLPPLPDLSQSAEHRSNLDSLLGAIFAGREEQLIELDEAERQLGSGKVKSEDFVSVLEVAWLRFKTTVLYPLIVTGFEDLTLRKELVEHMRSSAPPQKGSTAKEAAPPSHSSFPQ